MATQTSADSVVVAVYQNFAFIIISSKVMVGRIQVSFEPSFVVTIAVVRKVNSRATIEVNIIIIKRAFVKAKDQKSTYLTYFVIEVLSLINDSYTMVDFNGKTMMVYFKVIIAVFVQIEP